PARRPRGGQGRRLGRAGAGRRPCGRRGRARGSGRGAVGGGAAAARQAARGRHPRPWRGHEPRRRSRADALLGSHPLVARPRGEETAAADRGGRGSLTMANEKFDELDILRDAKAPAPGEAAKARALAAAMTAYDEAEKNAAAAQGSGEGARLTDRTIRFWREMMSKKLVAAPALAGLVALPVAGYVAWHVMEELRLAGAPGGAPQDSL